MAKSKTPPSRGDRWRYRWRFGPPPDPRNVIGVVALITVAFVAGLTMLRNVEPALTDATADWLSASAAVEGVDPWQDMQTLGSAFDVEIAPLGASELGEVERVHPRTPGMLLLLRPLAEIPAEHAYLAALLVIVAAYLSTVLWFNPLRGHTSQPTLLLLSTASIGFSALLSTMEFGTNSALLLLVISAAWALDVRNKGVASGMALGVAITMRMFPVLLLVPLWSKGSRRACYSAALTFVALNLTGLVTYRLNVQDALAGLSVAASSWMSFSGNGSLAMPLVRAGLQPTLVLVGLGVLGVIGSAFLTRRADDPDLAFAGVLVIAILCSPLSWEHYDLLALLAVALMVPMIDKRINPIPWVLVLTWAALQLIANLIDMVFASPGFSTYGVMALAGRLVALSAVFFIANQNTANRQPKQFKEARASG